MSDDVAVLDFDALLEMLGGKREVVASLLGTFLGELSSDVDASREAMAEQDTVALRQIAHRIKGYQCQPSCHDVVVCCARAGGGL